MKRRKPSIPAILRILAAAVCISLLVSSVSFAGGEYVPQNTKKPSWWQTTIAYEIYVSSFQDSDGNGVGDLRGITSRLPYLKSLGVGAVWLTPVYASPMVDNGYDISDYNSINPLYGSMADMEQLIAEADKLGIRIVMDLVFNHSSDQHAWFLASKQSRDNPKSDWYIWRDPKPDGSAPNNWRSIFGGSAWTWCEERQQYYLHTFAEAQPDLNWENPEVRNALRDVALFWENKGVGGFRMDAIPYIKKPAGLPDGAPDGADGMASIHNATAITDGILDYLREFKRGALDGKDVFTVAEANGVSPEDLHLWVGKNGVFDMLFEFSHVTLEFPQRDLWCSPAAWGLRDLKRVLGASQQATAENGWYPVFLENHDQPRSVSRFFPDSKAQSQTAKAKALGTILLTLRGTPFIYQGEELGLPNADWPSISSFNDLSTVNQYNTALQEGFSEPDALKGVSAFSRDNARTPMEWDFSTNAGFTTGTPWLPVHADFRNECMENQTKDPSSVLSWYRSVAALRQSSTALKTGVFTEYLKDDPQIYAYSRSAGADSVLVLVNLSDSPASFDPAALDLDEKSTLLLSNLGQPDNTSILRPWEARLYKW